MEINRKVQIDLQKIMQLRAAAATVAEAAEEDEVH